MATAFDELTEFNQELVEHYTRVFKKNGIEGLTMVVERDISAWKDKIRFTEFDKWLANEKASRKKKFIFIRTHTNNDVRNECRSKKKTRTQMLETDILDSTRNDCGSQLQAVTRKADIFLIDNHCRDMYGFPSLKKKLIDATDDIVREVIAMSFDAVTKDVMDGKMEILQNRVWKISSLTALAPRLGNTDIGILLDEEASSNEVQSVRTFLEPGSWDTDSDTDEFLK
ncbi:T-cell-specific guanine nucleotide triphosphate-binding protein 2-like [Mercenaria mercenaria]|uniref:T-cell-specific guanine nucleotide triphosphate-binding protein 2-like n=1 Tax=Mercenaria mercenaria TaxID=6596 RepID=UPI00234F0DCD|nr:T-cell-specific guanine nucleotide triphosphate-binding protein 2-like [Mercenaria mercenaria]